MPSASMACVKFSSSLPIFARSSVEVLSSGTSFDIFDMTSAISLDRRAMKSSCDSSSAGPLGTGRAEGGEEGLPGPDDEVIGSSFGFSDDCACAVAGALAENWSRTSIKQSRLVES